MKYTKALQDLIDSYMMLPGVGPKTAERYAFHTILKMNEEQVKKFSDDLIKARSLIRKCEVCGNLTEGEKCNICEGAGKGVGFGRSALGCRARLRACLHHF